MRGLGFRRNRLFFRFRDVSSASIVGQNDLMFFAGMVIERDV